MCMFFGMQVVFLVLYILCELFVISGFGLVWMVWGVFSFLFL